MPNFSGREDCHAISCSKHLGSRPPESSSELAGSLSPSSYLLVRGWASLGTGLMCPLLLRCIYRPGGPRQEAFVPS